MKTTTKFIATLTKITKKVPIRASTVLRIAGVVVTVVLAGLVLSAGSERSSAPSGSSQPVGRSLADSTKHGIAPGITSAANLKLSNQPGAPTSAPYGVGDVFVGVGTGFIKHFSPLGVLLDTLNTGTGCNEDLGMAFTSTSHLLATAAFGACFGAGQVVEFDDMGNLIGPFGSGYSSSTESIVIDASGDVYVGQPDGTMALKKFNSTGTFLMDFFPAPQNRGTDWNDLAADQCTMFYTSEGDAIKRFDVCTNTQLSDFASSAASPKYALRIRSNGEVLVAATSVLERYSAGGVLMQTYAFPGTFSFAMNLDPDGAHFWTADYITGMVYEYDIASGAIVFSFPSTPFTFASGLAVFGERTVGGPSPTPTPTPTPAGSPTSFVIGDLDAVVGNHVTFWGAQWAKLNHLSGGPAPSSFKGFANSPDPNPPACGGTWQSDPGNSSGPPPSVPADITVIVSSLITKSGPIISGDVPKMVVVHTDPGYKPNPGHAGTGTVTAVVCP